MSLVAIFDENPNFLRALNGYPTPSTKENTLQNQNPITSNEEPLDPTQVVALEEANVGSSEETTYVETPEHQAAESQFLSPGQINDREKRYAGVPVSELESRRLTDPDDLLALRTETGQLYNDEVATEYIEQAIRAVQLEHYEEPPATSDLFVVWFVKVLGNWKALVGQKSSTNYFEVTFNGAKNEVYVDRYGKISNTAIPGDKL